MTGIEGMATVVVCRRDGCKVLHGRDLDRDEYEYEQEREARRREFAQGLLEPTEEETADE